MVSSVSSIPYFSYLNQLQGNTTEVQPNGLPATTPDPVKTIDNSSSLVNSLLGKGGFSPSVLSLLQEGGSGNFDPISTIFGGSSSNNGLAKLYANLYNTQAASSLQAADVSPAKPAKTFSSQNLITDSVKTSVAYNNTIQQNAANAVKESKAKTDAVIS